MTKIHNETDLTVADIITWNKNNAMPFNSSPNKLSRIAELIYVVVKKEHLDSFRTNKAISKVNKKTGQTFYKNYTNLIKAKNNDNVKSQLKSTYSQELCNKLINIYFPKETIIFDPFSGIGTTALSCLKNNRYFIGSEIIKEHYELALNRIKQLENG